MLSVKKPSPRTPPRASFTNPALRSSARRRLFGFATPTEFSTIPPIPSTPDSPMFSALLPCFQNDSAVVNGVDINNTAIEQTMLSMEQAPIESPHGPLRGTIAVATATNMTAQARAVLEERLDSIKASPCKRRVNKLLAYSTLSVVCLLEHITNNIRSGMVSPQQAPMTTRGL